MVIQRWDPLRDLLHLQERVNRLFEESLARSGVVREAEAPAAWRPPVDLFEQEGRYVLRADLPGIDPGSVDIQLDESDLVLRGNRRTDSSVGRESYLRLERPSGSFAVRIALPPSVDGKKIEATHRNGVLEIVLPKKRDESQARIQVSVT
jgi:HSP20 family protein